MVRNSPFSTSKLLMVIFMALVLAVLGGLIVAQQTPAARPAVAGIYKARY